MNNDTFIQVWFFIILSIYGYTRILPVPVLQYPYPTRTREIATVPVPAGTSTGNPRVRVYPTALRLKRSVVCNVFFQADASVGT